MRTERRNSIPSAGSGPGWCTSALHHVYTGPSGSYEYRNMSFVFTTPLLSLLGGFQHTLTFSTNGRDQTSSCSRSGNKTLASISISKKNIYHNFFTATMYLLLSISVSEGTFDIYHDTIFSRQDIIIKNYLVYVAVYEPSLPCYPSLTLAQITLQISQLCPIFQWAICEL